jgi:SagB-type dehydrogenase family enzyme
MTDEFDKDFSLISAMENRRTIRELTGKSITSAKLNLLVWAAYGNTCNDGRCKLRTAPSAGATFPIELYLAIERVDGFADGIYRYSTRNEKIMAVKNGRFLKEISRASLDQDFIPLSNAAFLLVYNPQRIMRHYGRDSRKYALLECGHIAQNILLTATAQKLGSVPVGAFYQRQLGSILKLDDNREVLYMICVGTVD